MSPTPRPGPRTFSCSWPVESCSSSPAEFARRFALHLNDAIGSRAIRDVERITGVDRVTLSRILDGRTWPNRRTIACLEIGLQRNLWPLHHC